uniref:Ankyrin repeat domain-containing protein n=1 Tax=Haptolina brevifila TaxID=156173 RepID=A0A7S2GJ89_9EUKA|mmetsp:Transcript_39989/g.80139  ORF Transcript_39989/g.80139 Transcript_39989/m.80139 type:complete len:232 (+) Transcript_39989:74-769(+)
MSSKKGRGKHKGMRSASTVVPPIRARHTHDSHASLLWQAARAGKVEEVHELLCSGVDVNSVTSTGATALIIAAYYDHPIVIERLIQQPNIDVNLCSARVGTALHVCAQRGHAAAAYMLLTHPGCDPNARMYLGALNNGYHTALMLAAQGGHMRVVTLLLHQPSISSSEVLGALYMATQQSHHDIVKRLIEHPSVTIPPEQIAIIEEQLAHAPSLSAATNPMHPGSTVGQLQ